MKSRHYFLQRSFFTCLLYLLIVSGCRPTVDLVPASGTVLQNPVYTVEADTYAALFNALWQGMNENYVYWDIEPVDYWDTMRDTYKPRFDALGPYPGSDDRADEAMTCFAAMLGPLKDGHLIMKLGLGPNYYTYPARKKVRARYAEADPNTNPVGAFYSNNWSGVPNDWNPDAYNFWTGTIKGYFTDTDSITLNPESPNEFFHIAVGRKTLGGSDYILYLYLSSFAINANLKDPGVFSVMQRFMRDLVGEGCKGVVFDLRGNFGGENNDVALLLAPLLDRDVVIGHDRSKKSLGRLDYLPYAPELMLAASGDATLKLFGLPDLKARAVNAGTIAVSALVNDYSASAGEVLPIAIQAMGGRITGTQTWGATGPLVGEHSSGYVNGGSFTIADSMGEIVIMVDEAGWQFRGLNFENYEGIGVTPDYPVPFDYAQFKPASGKGTDVQLEKALAVTESKIRTGFWPQ